MSYASVPVVLTALVSLTSASLVLVGTQDSTPL